jgi:hypothetical protein
VMGCSRKRLVLAAMVRSQVSKGARPGASNNQSDFPRLAGGTIPFMRRYSTICP